MTPARAASPLPAAMLLCLAGVPLAIAPGVVLEYEVTPKLALLLAGAAVMLLVWRDWEAGAGALLRNRTGRVFAGILALQAASLTASTLVSRTPGLALAGTGWRRLGVVTQLAIAIFAFVAASHAAQRRKAVRSALAALVGAAAVVTLYAAAQYAGQDPFLTRALYTTDYGGDVVRVPGTLEHGVYLGAFLAAVAPLAFGLGVHGSRGRRILYWGIGYLLVAGTVLSGSRSAVLGLACALVVGVRGVPFGRNVARAAAWGCAALLIAGAIFVEMPAGASLRLRLTQWRDDAYGGARLAVWRDSLRVAAQRPLLGFGPESFGNEFRQRQSAELSRSYPDFVHTSAHNAAIDIAVCQGVPGLAVLAGMLWLIFAPRAGSLDPIERTLQASAAGLCVALCFIPMTISLALLFYVDVGLLVSLRVEAPPARGSGLIRAVAVCCAMALAFAAVAYWRQDLSYGRVSRAAAAGDVAGMAGAYRASAGMWFPRSGDDLWCSRQFAAAAMRVAGAPAAEAWAAAAAAAEKAAETSDQRSDAKFQSALLAIGADDPAAAERKLREAIECAPNWHKPHLLLSQLLSAVGRTADANSEAQLAAALGATAK